VVTCVGVCVVFTFLLLAWGWWRDQADKPMLQREQHRAAEARIEGLARFDHEDPRQKGAPRWLVNFKDMTATMHYSRYDDAPSSWGREYALRRRGAGLWEIRDPSYSPARHEAVLATTTDPKRRA
jgi:hypothetical protein